MLDEVKNKIRAIPDFPEKGIVFQDLTPLLADGELFSRVIDGMQRRTEGLSFDVLVGIESRGFIFAAALASRLKKGLLIARKPGKLGAEKVRVSYELEYGSDALEMHTDLLPRHTKCLIVDDVLATGGTAIAAARLLNEAGLQPVGYLFCLEIAGLKAAQNLRLPMQSFLQV